MSRLIESIKLHDGRLFNLDYHQQRVARSLNLIVGDSPDLFTLKQIEIPESFKSGLFKCRVVYDHTGILQVSFEPYSIKQITSLKLVKDDNLEYTLKWEDREHINTLYNAKGNADDVLIVKQGAITDTSYANVIFSKDGSWYTPAKPLLHGTMRQKLIDEHKIIPVEIKLEQISEFKTCKLINALLEFDGPEIAVADIVL